MMPHTPVGNLSENGLAYQTVLCYEAAPTILEQRMPKRSKRREWTKDDVRELKDACSPEDASSKNSEVAQTDTWSNSAEGVLPWRIIRFAGIIPCCKHDQLNGTPPIAIAASPRISRSIKDINPVL